MRSSIALGALLALGLLQALSCIGHSRDLPTGDDGLSRRDPGT